MPQLRSSRNPASKECVDEKRIVEAVNLLDSAKFHDIYLTTPVEPGLAKLQQTYSISFTFLDADTIKLVWLQQCFDLIETTSRDDYASSEVGWKPAAKKREMLLPDMKYIVLYEQDQTPHSTVKPSILAGFISYMITYEDGLEVLYIYEIHFKSIWQGKGLGKVLIAVVESVARRVGLVKVMLTVFRGNKRAVEWYQKMGYCTDPFSPSPKHLRGGTIKTPGYLILSKSALQYEESRTVQQDHVAST